MSLLQDFENFTNNLAKEYNEPDMRNILDEYCEEVVRTNKPEAIADSYVLSADKERFEKSEGIDKIDEFNSGHVFTGVMNNENLFNKFIDWYKANYLTYEDIHDHYDDLGKCLRDNFVPRLEHVVLAELIANGCKAYSAEDVKIAFAKIDEDEKNRNRGMQTDEDGRTFFDATPTKEFLKMIVRACYKAARDFEPIQMIQYISREANVSYEKPVERYFYVDDGDKVITLSGQNNNQVMDAMQEMLSQMFILHDDDFGYDEDLYDNLYPSACEMDICETTQSFTVDCNDSEFGKNQKDEEKTL